MTDQPMTDAEHSSISRGLAEHWDAMAARAQAINDLLRILSKDARDVDEFEPFHEHLEDAKSLTGWAILSAESLRDRYRLDQSSNG